MVMSTVPRLFRSFEAVTEKVSEYTPGSVGIPLTKPSGASRSPGGSEPPTRFQV